jgi:LuxR family transcriptional regulator, maltose regulon positive regulatory protein
VLITAPAGWGKTSLLRDWCASGEAAATAWLSVDQGDNDLARFWTGVIAALRTVYPQVGDDTRRMLRAPGPPGNAVTGRAGPLALKQVRPAGRACHDKPHVCC